MRGPGIKFEPHVRPSFGLTRAPTESLTQPDKGGLPQHLSVVISTTVNGRFPRPALTFAASRHLVPSAYCAFPRNGTNIAHLRHSLGV